MSVKLSSGLVIAMVPIKKMRLIPLSRIAGTMAPRYISTYREGEMCESVIWAPRCERTVVQPCIADERAGASLVEPWIVVKRGLEARSDGILEGLRA